jgi:hypothetical protein
MMGYEAICLEVVILLTFVLVVIYLTSALLPRVLDKGYCLLRRSDKYLLHLTSHVKTLPLFTIYLTDKIRESQNTFILV